MESIVFETVRTNGINIRVASMGEGPLVVFCHGWPESWYSYRHQLPAIAQAGYRAVAFDVRGYGESDKPHEICDYTMNICTDCHYCFSKSNPKDREINLRPPGVGLLADENISTSNMAFVILILSTVTFDGLTSTPLWGSIQDSMFISMSAVFGENALTGIESLGLLLFPCIFFSIYLVE